LPLHYVIVYLGLCK